MPHHDVRGMRREHASSKECESFFSASVKSEVAAPNLKCLLCPLAAQTLHKSNVDY